MGFGTVKGFPGVQLDSGKPVATLKAVAGNSVSLPMANPSPSLTVA